MGLPCETFHACKNDCVVFRKELEGSSSCPECKEDRYKPTTSANVKQVAWKVLHYFPIIPRIQQVFRCKDLAALMSWHVLNVSRDSVMRIPADAKAWKHVDSTFPDFAAEPRNLRLGLASDGFSPYSQ